MNKTLVIGYGNPFRGDDGVGFRAAEELQDSNQNHVAIEVIATQELKPEMIESASKSNLVIFIDATAEGVPGTVRTQSISPAGNCDGVFSHELTPCTLLAAAKIIYGNCPEAFLISVAGENFGFSTNLTPKVEAALPKVFDCIRELVAGVRQPGMAVSA